MTTMKRERTVRIFGMNDDEHGVASILGVVLMISLVVMITSVVAAFVFDAVCGEKQSPCAELVVKGAVEGDDNYNITIVHYGGDAISVGSAGNPNIEIKYNGQVCNLIGNTTPPLDPAMDPTFNLGDELEVNVTYGATGDANRNLTEGDSICILYTPSRSILQRVRVVR